MITSWSLHHLSTRGSQVADADRAVVNNFLKRFKTKMSSDGLIFVKRKPNLDSIAKLGFTIAEVERIILSLTEKNYSKGPETDDDGTAGEIWVFGVSEAGSEIYVKLKLDAAAAKCLSFHHSDYPVRLPYR